MNSESKKVISFAGFELDPSRRRLMREGKPLALNAKAFDLLVFLTENSGRVVTKDEILNAVWKDQFVEEANLTVQVSALRKALGETRGAPRFLVTVPGRGYEFIADTRMGNEIVIENHRFSRVVIEQESEQEEKHEIPDNTPTSYFSQRLILGVAAAGILVLLAGGTGIWFLRAVRTTDETGRPRFTRLLTNADISNATLTPDSKYVVYAEREQNGETLWLKQIATGSQTRIVPPQNLEYLGLTVTPDNSFVYASVYLESKSDTPLWRIPLLGGAAEEIPGIITGTAVTFSPDGKQFAFTSSLSAARETYLNICNADGSSARVLLSAADAKRDFVVWGANPIAWSPDGSDIAVAVEEKEAGGESKAAIILVDPWDGSERSLLTPRFTVIESLAWIDAEDLSFISNEKENRVSQIWTISKTTGVTQKITDDLQKYTRLATARGVLLSLQQTGAGHLKIADFDEKTKALAPREILNEGPIEYTAWTEDGKVLYTSLKSGSCEIWRIGKDGANAEQITSGAQIGHGFAVSPIDGSLVFSSVRNGKNALWLANADGKNIRPLVDGVDDVFPEFTPDGQAVIFQRGYGNKIQTIWRVNIADGSLTQFTEHRSLYPAISPDGSQIAYYSLSKNAKRESIWAIDLISSVNGASIKYIDAPKGILTDRFLRWRPGGKFLSQIERVGNSLDLFLIPVNGGEPQIFSGIGSDHVEWFDWSRDGKEVAVSQTTEMQDLVLIK
jgi:DNA-binding winged helix-turn-helix (wHTH) protein/Tol biopolymer transport system component